MATMFLILFYPMRRLLFQRQIPFWRVAAIYLWLSLGVYPCLAVFFSTATVSAVSLGNGRGTGIGSYLVTTIAGSGVKGYLDASKEKAQFNWPTGVAVDDKGNIYVADFLNNMIRKVNKDGEVITFLGSGHAAFADGKGRLAHLRGPDNIALDKEGNIYVADRGSHTIRKIVEGSAVTTIAGNGYPAYLDGNGVKTHFREPISLAVDRDGNIYVADSGNNAIRKITPDGTVSTLAGGSKPGYKDGKGHDARFSWPTGVAIDSFGNIYVCDSQNNRIRRITPEGVVSTVAGMGIPGFADGTGYNVQFRFPTGIGVDKTGNIYVADSGNNRIRKISQGGILQAQLLLP